MSVLAVGRFILLTFVYHSVLGPTHAQNDLSPGESRVDSIAAKTILESLPILMYDSDVGFGYGLKVFLLNSFRGEESVDLILFRSTKGERYYRIVFSLPDFERRQGKVYPLAIDVVVEYDKYIKNNFFGIGSQSKFQDREYYTKEPLEFSLTFSRGMTSEIVAQAGVRHKVVRNFNFQELSRLATLSSRLNTGRVHYSSFLLTIRYDTRNSFINPSRGIVLQGETEFAPELLPGNVQFTRLGMWVQYYAMPFHSSVVSAFRVGLQGLRGDSIPVQVLLPIGGGSTLRGSPQDRYLDKISIVSNAELRFPIAWRFGGVVGLDLGKVWSEIKDVDLHGWTVNPTVGLRFYMKTFVVRFDVGFGRETTGFYFNFGHVF